MAATPAATGRIDLTGNVTATIAPTIPVGRDTDGDGLDDRFEAYRLDRDDSPEDLSRLVLAESRRFELRRALRRVHHPRRVD